MKQSSLSDSQMEFLAVFEAFSPSVPGEIVGALVPYSGDQSARLMEQIIQAGWIIKESDYLFRLAPDLPGQTMEALRKINTAARLTEMLDQLKDLDLYDRLDPGCLINLFERVGRTKEMRYLPMSTL